MMPTPVRAIGAATAVLLLCLSAGCSRERDDWRSAQAADTPTSYERFLHEYPRSAHVSEANTRLAQLAEDEAWQGATSIDTQMGYQQFLARYPEGKWAQEARVRIENFSLTAPSTAPAPVVPQPESRLEPKPETKADKPPAAPKAAKPAGGKKETAAKKGATARHPEGFGVQLGAFSSQEKAESVWGQLQQRFPSELGSSAHQVSPGRSGAGQVFRLRVPQSGEAAARKVCAALKARNEVCIPYRP
jgi:cell division septation protein DedD